MGSVCRIGPNEGPPLRLAERGIGGTGGSEATTPAPSPRPGSATGAGSKTPSDRGIGGTGIVGVITGFGSVCLDGLEVQYDPALPINVEPGSPLQGDLRAGQLAVVAANGPPGALRADSIAVRYEVVGPVQSVSPAGGGARLLQVAGQPVLVQEPTYGDPVPAVDAWVAVSGLRDPRGAIVATRLDRVDPAATEGAVLVHGRISAGDGVLRLGALRVAPRAGILVADGSYVTVTGPVRDGVLDAGSFLPDPLQTAPDAGFGPDVGALFIETYDDGLGLGLDGPAWQGGLGAGLRGRRGLGREVVALRRDQGGRFQATGLVASDRGQAGSQSGSASGAAPMPGNAVAPSSSGTAPARGGSAISGGRALPGGAGGSGSGTGGGFSGGGTGGFGGASSGGPGGGSLGGGSLGGGSRPR